METKKIVLPTIIAVVTLIALVAGATYAYFAVGTTNNFGTAKIEASAESVGTVAIAAGDSLSLEVTAVDMMNQDRDVTFYATKEGGAVTSQATAPAIATASVTGNGTFNCTFGLNITASSTGTNMLTKLKAMQSPKPTEGQLILTVAGTDYDLYKTDVTFPKKINVSLNGLKAGDANKQNITAQLRLINKHGEDGNLVSASQNDLADTDLKLTFTLADNDITCTAVSES